jgi:hypothetical protein
MLGAKNGLAGHLKQLGLKCVFLHCIIHQEVLCGKIIKMNQTVKTVVNIVNLIRRGNKAQRAFTKFLEEMDTYYSDIPLHSDIRQSSAEKCFQRFFALRKEILMFLQTENLGQEFHRELQDMGFICFLALLANISLKCPEFEIARQRAECISPSWSH